MVANAFVRIFSKPQSNVDTFAENNFSGKISHSPRKPFKDGWSTGVTPSPPASAAQRSQEEAEGYLDGAVKRVVSNNFTGDETEPGWGGNAGWTGDIHTREAREGFHAKKL